MKKYKKLLLTPLAVLGMFDAGYLTYEHYTDSIPVCTTHILFADCGKVLQSQYSVVMGVPLATIGLIHYTLLSVLLYAAVTKGNRFARTAALIQSTAGLFASAYFVYLQLFVIQALCFYCMLSAFISTVLFLLIVSTFEKERKRLFIHTAAFMYRHVVKHFFFKLPPEFIHNRMTHTGEILGMNRLTKSALSSVLTYKDPVLKQEIAGITFSNPVGLSAGFDYEARLTQILPSLGFGFGTVGTITNLPYGGNPKPMLGRLPKSKSLMVNKGFKNLGAKRMIEKLSDKPFAIPIGISIGRTNTRMLTSQKQSVSDIVEAFTAFEKSRLNHSYYELNISCPNLYGDVTFYPPKHLRELLAEVDKLKVKRPIFIKMPIELSNVEVLQLLAVIAKHSPKGVIFGNLQKDRNNPTFIQKEVKKFPVGNFSGKPTYERSNELIYFTHKYYAYRFVIIGSGGVFSAQDAYTKITLGASLVQLITGMIFQGPQLIAQINHGLVDLLKKDGFTHISQAVGTKKLVI